VDDALVSGQCLLSHAEVWRILSHGDMECPEGSPPAPGASGAHLLRSEHPGNEKWDALLVTELQRRIANSKAPCLAKAAGSA